MSTISVKISPTLDRAVEGLAKSRGVTKSAVIREALERYLAADTRPARGSFLALAKDYAGCLEGGPADLSSNAEHLEDYGR
ncbi:MAG TPA: ribbon-helix-helix protein, CopG family [Thermoanaerobaculia bacterium]|nr:ribbon-helix-helix protein, CopG family [Thermoanaerobaculia bacterium]